VRLAHRLEARSIECGPTVIHAPARQEYRGEVPSLSCETVAQIQHSSVQYVSFACS
jgi:hypothetical protein